MSATQGQRMRPMPRLVNWDRDAAQQFVNAHRAGKFVEASGYLMEAFDWASDPYSKNGAVWCKIHEELQAYPAKPCELAADLLASWIEESKPGKGDSYKTTKPAQAQAQPALTEAAVAVWLRERGMVMVKADDLRDLKRNGSGSPPPFTAAQMRRIANFG